MIENDNPTYRDSHLAWEASLGNRAEHWYLAVDAVVIVPVGEELGDPAPAPPGGKPDRKVVLSVDCRDVPAITQAMAAKDIVMTVALHAASRAKKVAAAPGMKEVPVAPTGVPAFEPLTFQSLIDPQTRREAWRWIRKQRSKASTSSSAGRISSGGS